MARRNDASFMNYSAFLNKTLKPPRRRHPLALDLFAGCGGLALGFEAAGFETHGFEEDDDCCKTYNKNLKGRCSKLSLSIGTRLPKADVLLGGPPCQPFSVGGNQMGLKDSRDGFPIFIDAVKRVQPRIWLFENVRGMLYGNRAYFDEILRELMALNYIVEFRLLNAVDFGVPQNRERIIVVGHRGFFDFPPPQISRVTAGEALGRMPTTAPKGSRFLTPSMDKYIAKYEKASNCIQPRDLNLNKPARTLTCRNLAGATGDMQRIKLPDGRRRRLLPREAARLQSFPDFFSFVGGETSVFYQIGNAVAPLFAFHLAQSIRKYLKDSPELSRDEIRIRNSPNQLELNLAA